MNDRNVIRNPLMQLFWFLELQSCIFTVCTVNKKTSLTRELITKTTYLHLLIYSVFEDFFDPQGALWIKNTSLIISPNLTCILYSNPTLKVLIVYINCLFYTWQACLPIRYLFTPHLSLYPSIALTICLTKHFSISFSSLEARLKLKNTYKWSPGNIKKANCPLSLNMTCKI